MNGKKLGAYLIIGGCYAAACAVGWLVFLLLTPERNGASDIVWGLLAGDAAATVIVWAFGLIFKNSSFYDPYWSLVPWLLILGVMIRYNLFRSANIVFLTVFGGWSWRLTINWAYTCTDLKCQDWRYVMFKEQNKPVMWHIINFFGINMIPTALVFIGTMPAVLMLLENADFAPSMLTGAAVIIGAVLLEVFADLAMHGFRRNNTDPAAVLKSGLWKFSRHPNYFGEISMWLGVYLMALPVIYDKWYMFAGFVLIAALFGFISIPLMEKRQTAKRAGYKEYIRTTSPLFPLPPKLWRVITKLKKN
ncbi:MAG: DUF1295 domain-containing protein [Clostridiales bacterium]|jgi:steroid 5-alpha reductase family enzyme|nr:DUF1295 domain-containing protein [Clostridiales bacterium]